MPLVDLFCGAGGLSYGLKKAGFCPIFAADIDPHSVNTYNDNIGSHAIVADISKLSSSYILEQLQHKDIILVAGGPPCQGFSIQRRGSAIDPRNDLVVTFTRLAVELHPKFILIENVPGLLGVRGREYFNNIKLILNGADYQFKASMLNAVDFGIPQHRRRAFIVCWKSDLGITFEYPKPRANGERKTVRDAIGDLPEPPEDYTSHPNYFNHVRVRISATNVQRLSHVPPGGGRRDIPLKLQLRCHRDSNNHRHLDVFGRMQWDEPAPTITAVFDNASRGRFAHPEHNRVITAREGARIQTFPDDFCFSGPKKDVARQIGNAVPPQLAKYLGDTILHFLNKKNLLETNEQLPLSFR